MKELDFFSILKLFTKYRKKVYAIIFLFLIGFTILAFALPKYYKSEATIYPPISESGLSIPLGSLGAIAGNLFGGSQFQLPVFASASDVWVSLLKSNEMALHLCTKFDLFRYYHIKDSVVILKYFQSDFQIEPGRDGSIKISFEKKEDPEGAYQIVKEAIDYLNVLDNKRNITLASNKRKFIEKRLAVVSKELKESQDKLIEFQKKNNLVAIPEQTQALIANISSLISNLTMNRIELSALEAQYKGENSLKYQLQKKVEETEKLLSKLYEKSDSLLWENKFLPTFKNLPELGVQYLELYRNVKVNEILYELLIQQLEQVKINEVKDTPTIHVLDPPFIPDYKSKPKRAIIMALGLILGIFFSIFYILLKEFNRNLERNNPEKAKIWHDFVKSLKSDIMFWRRENV